MEELVVIEEIAGVRFDKALVEMFGITRTKSQALIESGSVFLNDVICINKNLKVKTGDVIRFDDSEIKPVNQGYSHLEPADIALDIVYEDEDLCVINKQAGLVVHPGAGNLNNTLVNALVHYYGGSQDGDASIFSESNSERPGIVHRLDKDTSGLMIVAKNEAAHLELSRQLAERMLKRSYACFVWGMLSPISGVIEHNIGRQTQDRTKMKVMRFGGGKTAITHYETKKISKNGAISFVECRLETGRTHQIRVHMSHVGHSILGDQIYGHNARKLLHSNLGANIKESLSNFKRQALHSQEIGFIHPVSGQEMHFVQKLPDDMKGIFDLLFSDES